MRNVIYKYDLEIGKTILFLGISDRIMDIQAQDGQICMWVMVDLDDRRKSPRTFEVQATGHEFDGSNLNYLRTVQDGPFVWHVFEVLPHADRKN